MKTFALLQDGRLFVVFSDNTDEETMDLIPQDQWDDENGNYDAEWICCEEHPYSAIKQTDSNRYALAL